MVSSESQNISNEFLSPLVKSIVKAEGLDQEELKLIRGVEKQPNHQKDILTYLSQPEIHLPLLKINIQP